MTSNRSGLTSLLVILSATTFCAIATAAAIWQTSRPVVDLVVTLFN